MSKRIKYFQSRQVMIKVLRYLYNYVLNKNIIITWLISKLDKHEFPHKINVNNKKLKLT